MRIAKTGPKRHHLKHRVPVLLNQEEAWSELSVDTIVHAKAEALSLKHTYKKLQVRIKRFREMLAWLNSDSSAINFQTACDNAGAPPELVRDAILDAGPTELVQFLTHPQAKCPFCGRKE